MLFRSLTPGMGDMVFILVVFMAIVIGLPIVYNLAAKLIPKTFSFAIGGRALDNPADLRLPAAPSKLHASP